tara:strand:+ start:5004 stop:5519 length:516 start_codon:yes stop_codon:yes gene_type:complete
MDENNRKCLMNLILISVTVLLSVQMVKSLNRLGLVETFFQEVADNSVPTTGQEVGKDGLGAKDPAVIFGHPKGLENKRMVSNSNPDENAPSDGKGNRTKVLFKHNECKPECCASSSGQDTNYSCDKGCVCMDKAQNELVASRGDGVYPSQADTTLSYRNKCIINDEFCQNS